MASTFNYGEPAAEHFAQVIDALQNDKISIENAAIQLNIRPGSPAYVLLVKMMPGGINQQEAMKRMHDEQKKYETE